MPLPEHPAAPVNHPSYFPKVKVDFDIVWWKNLRVNWFWFILVGLAAGFLAGAVVKGHGFGLVGNLLVGVIGALLGGFLFGLLGLVAIGLIGNLISAFVGAVVLLWLLGIIKRKGG
jgi:uncharacterized membrane protein YeaQ/YmgE (transglycosylase-associated protein family)